MVAKGVELEKIKEFPIENECDEIQGYLIAKPLSGKDAFEMLRDRKSVV